MGVAKRDPYSLRDGRRKTVVRGRIVMLMTAWPVLMGWSISIAAPHIKVQQIHFAAGASSSIVKGTIAGDKIVDYKLSTKAGQTMSVTLKTRSAAMYSNVLPPGAEKVLFIGSTSGNKWHAT